MSNRARPIAQDTASGAPPARHRAWLALAGVVAAIVPTALWLLVLVLPRARAGVGSPSPDTYGYTTPMWLQAQRAWSSGHGLLWNDLQNAGQPLLANPASTLLYPPTWLLAAFDLVTWQIAWIVLHMTIAGLGAYALSRELGLTRLPSAATALAFQLGGLLGFFSMWSPIVLASFCWLPVSLLAAERLLSRPSIAAAAGLAVSLALALTAGYPQIAAFIAALVGLRAGWEVATRRRWPWQRALRLFASAALLLALLSAAYLAPGFEVASESVRSASITVESITREQSTRPAIDRVRARVETRSPGGGLLAVALTLAGAGLARPGSRRIAWFYALAGGLALALVPDSPLRDAYQKLPVLGSLRAPNRLAWITSACTCLLVGHGVAAISEARSRRAVAGALAGGLSGALAFHLLAPSGLLLREVGLIAALLVAPVAAARWPAMRVTLEPLTAGVLIVDIACSLLGDVPRLILDDREPRAAHTAFEFVAEYHTPQDRVFVWPRNRWLGTDVRLLDKTPSLYSLPSVSDYEHLTSLRYATFYVYMTSGRMIEHAGQWITQAGATPTRLPLFDQLAARWIVTDRPGRRIAKRMLPERFRDGELRVLENPQALPRAYYVAEAAVVDDPARLLATLASPQHDPRRQVLLDRPPRAGFPGDRVDAPDRPGRAEVRREAGEELVIAVEAPQPGFLVVTDQYFPGWTAHLRGEETEILRANYAFRAVAVPAGSSQVVFRYAPASLRWGFRISSATLIALVAAGIYRAVRSTREPRDSPN